MIYQIGNKKQKNIYLVKYLYPNNQIIEKIVDRIKIVNKENHNNYRMT